MPQAPSGVHRFRGGGKSGADRVLSGLSGAECAGNPRADCRQQGDGRGRTTVGREVHVSQSDREGGRFLGGLFGRGRHDAWAAGPQSRIPVQLNLDDIQGFILRGYRMPLVRHFLLTVSAPDEARMLLGRLVSGDEADAPQVTTAKDWYVGFAPGPADNPAETPRR